MASVEKPGGRQWGALAFALALVVAVVAGGWWAWSRQPKGPLARARIAYERSDWQGAWSLASEHLRTDPNDFDALLITARATARLGRDDLAQTIYDRRIGMERMSGEDYFLVGEGLLRQDKAVIAMAALEKGLTVDPRQPELLQELTRQYAREDKLAKAASLASRLAEVAGWQARGELLGGILAAEQSNPAASAKHIEAALRLDPALRGGAANPVATRKLLARALLQDNKPVEARTSLQAVLATHPDHETEWLLSRAFLLEGNFAEASAALERSHGFGEESGNPREPAPYVGSAKCAECHATIHRSQQKSLHAKTFIPTAQLSRLPLPGRPLPDPDTPGIVHKIEKAGDGVRVETRADDQTYRALVDYAIGSGDRGMTLVGRDEQGGFRELRLSRYNDGSGWDRTTGHPVKPHHPADSLGEPLTEDAVRRCLHCHTTDAHAALAQVGPTAADHSIGCERCHGPGGSHVKAVEEHFPDLAIARPQHFSAPRVIQLCGQCHSPRGGTLSDDNAPSNVRFQAATLVKSRCYTESGGSLSCITCHNPHRDAETTASFYENKCLSCHTATQTVARPETTKAQVACPINPAADCLKCHMPVVKNAVPHSPFSDHYIRVHRETR